MEKHNKNNRLRVKVRTFTGMSSCTEEEVYLNVSDTLQIGDNSNMSCPALTLKLIDENSVEIELFTHTVRQLFQEK